MEQTVLTAISTVGFPIVVTFYLLTRFQRSMDQFTSQLEELVKELQRREHIGA
ncbi:MAG: YvrJ family protein [Selenomonas sp.]|nr:YvrJ family protein [Selenomonas sp.]MCH3960157.1 YvrJ family protein [Selenomonas sp.]